MIAWLDHWAGPIALQVAVAATLILVVALLVSWSLRRSAASLRHRVWALAVLGLLAYPLVHPILPRFSLGLRTASSKTSANAGPTTENPSEPRLLAHDTALPVQIRNLTEEAAARTGTPTDSFSVPKSRTSDNGDGRLPAAEIATRAFAYHWPSILAALWAIGAAIGLGFLVNVHVAASRLVRTAAAPADPSWSDLAVALAAQLGVRRRVAVRVSDRIAVPVTAGWLHPAILLPSDCEQWLAPRRRMVLIHEMSHVARGDVLWQIGAKLACVIYWPHPLVWLAARRMRVEREAACDDAVVRDVERPSEYASLLLDVAASLASHPTGMGTAVAMACGRSVEERIRWIVQPGRCRLPIGRRTARLFSVGAILIVLGLGSISIFAGPPEIAKQDATAEPEKRPAEEYQTRWYQVADLVMPIPPLIISAPSAEPRIEQSGTKPDFDSLVNLITSTIQPRTWKSAGGQGTAAVSKSNLSIVLSQTRAVHDEISNLLTQLRRTADLGVVLAIQLGEASDEPMPDTLKSQGTAGHIATGATAAAVVATTPMENTVAKPQIKLMNGQMAYFDCLGKDGALPPRFCVQAVVPNDRRSVRLSVHTAERRDGSVVPVAMVALASVPEGRSLEVWLPLAPRRQDGVPRSSDAKTAMAYRKLVITPRIVIPKEKQEKLGVSGNSSVSLPGVFPPGDSVTHSS
jgi:beta-lactamase regulating signal transducer with metallopeptidase domain